MSAEWYSAISSGEFWPSRWTCRDGSSATALRVTRCSSIGGNDSSAFSSRTATISRSPPLRCRSPPTNSTRTGASLRQCSRFAGPPALDVDARRDHGHLGGGHAVAGDEAVARPCRPGDHVLGVAQGAHVEPLLRPLDRRRSDVVGVELAERVVLLGRGVERHHRRDHPQPPTEQHGDHLGVSEQRIDRIAPLQPADQLAGLAAEPQRPVRQHGHLGQRAERVARDRHRDQLDRR